MSFLIIRGERFALEFGPTTLGGLAEGALQSGSLVGLPAFAVIDYPVEGSSTIRAVGGTRVMLNGEQVGLDEQPLHHGDRIVAAGCEMVYGDMRASGSTRQPRNAAGDPAAATTVQLPGERLPTAPTGGRLVRQSDGAVFGVPDDGLTIGRDPDCGLPLTSREASRLHAVVAPSLFGYTLTDRSANGVRVNGRRVDEQCVLGQHDVVLIAGEELRFEADEATFEPSLRER